MIVSSLVLLPFRASTKAATAVPERASGLKQGSPAKAVTLALCTIAMGVTVGTSAATRVRGGYAAGPSVVMRWIVRGGSVPVGRGVRRVDVGQHRGLWAGSYGADGPSSAAGTRRADDRW